MSGGGTCMPWYAITYIVRFSELNFVEKLHRCMIFDFSADYSAASHE
jgi:hypothetical protein